MTTTLTVADRIATISTDEKIVAGNTYPVTLSLDSEWTGTYYVRVRFGSLYYDIPASGSSVNVQIPVGYPEVGLGIYSENIGICTNEVRVKVLRSILEQGVSVVEFDTDLYTQWQNEVSELVCDSDFDAESERPVKNSVLTAWKDTVPLDSALVHRTGDETVNGLKTFTNRIVVNREYANLDLVSTQAYNATGRKSEQRVYDQKDGQPSMFGERSASTANGYNAFVDFVYTPDRSRSFSFVEKAFADHAILSVTPYYPVDGQGNPQALSADALMASGNIAVDPRLVHTSGVETIAGEKTLTGKPTVRASAEAYLDLVTGKGYQAEGYKSEIRFYDQKDGASNVLNRRVVGTATSGQYSYATSILYNYARDNSYVVEQRAFSDHAMLVMPTYYPVDGQGNPQALPVNAFETSGNISVDPRIVHTTGNETVAGTKTFTNGIDAYPQNWHPTAKTGMSVGQYVIFAEITALNSVGRFVAVDFIQSSNTASCMGRMLFRCKIDASENPLAVWVYRKSKGSNDPLSAHSIVVLYKDGHAYLAWKREAPYGAVVARIAQDMGYGSVQSSTSSAVRFIPSADMTVLNNLDGYTVYEVTE